MFHIIIKHKTLKLSEWEEHWGIYGEQSKFALFADDAWKLDLDRMIYYRPQ